MLFDIIAFPLFLIALYVLGAGVLRLRGGAEYPVWFYLVTALFTLGCVAVVANFFVGVNSVYYYAVIGALFTYGGLKIRAEDVAILKRLLPYSLLLVPLAAYMAAGSDAGLYHIPHQKLIRDEKIILGIANLHSRYGFSSMLEYVLAPLWIGERFRLLPYAHAAFMAAWLLFVWDLIKSSNKHIAALGWLTALSMLVYCMYLDFGYTSTDVPSGLLYAIAFLLGVSLLLEKGSVSRTQLTVFFTCSLFAFMCKLSGVVVMLWAGYVSLYLLYQRRIAFKPLLETALLPLLILAVWLVKNIMASGCVFYPDVSTCLNVPWAAKANAVENAAGVTAWARQPRASLRPLESWDWLTAWWLPYYTLFLSFLLASLIVVCVAYTKFFRTEKLRIHRVALPALFFMLCGLAFWFFKAPTPRFGIGTFILLTPMVAIALLGFRFTDSPRILRLAPILILLLAFRLGVATNTDVMRGFYRLKIMPDLLAAPAVSVKEAPNFGFKPTGTDIDSDAICWTAKYCAPDPRPPICEMRGYKIFKPENM